jgi:Ca-activated chloride channel family protein
LLLLVELLIPETAKRRSEVTDQVSRRTAAMALALFLCPPRAAAASNEAALRRGNAHYDRQQYEQALEQYSVAGKKNPKDRRPVFNAGDALYKLEQYDKAAEAFDAVAKSGGPPDIQAQAYYNLGNAFSRKGDHKEAVNAFRKAVALTPSDEEARRNLAVALRHLKDPPKKDDKKKDDQYKKDQKKEQPKPQDQKGGGQQPPPQPKTRPQDQISKEDAERILRAVADREKASPKQLEKAPLKRPAVEEDW